MPDVRVLVVDDSFVVRHIVSDSLEAVPGLHVVGTAPNGKVALDMLDEIEPDAIVLDLEMPEMDGLETLTELRKSRPRLPVVVFSTLTERGAAATLEALAHGASDYVTKPSNVGNASLAMERIRTELAPKLTTLCSPAQIPPLSAPAPISTKEPAAAMIPSSPSRSPATTASSTEVHRAGSPGASSQHIELVAIGVSTGGPQALEVLVPELPADLPVPVLVVQHMPPLFTAKLAERLDRHSALRVAEGYEGAAVGPGEVWIAPGDYHMTIELGCEGPVLRTGQGPPENFCRPAVDVLFRSAATAYRRGVLAVVMTGMGQDGLLGAQQIVAGGGTVVVQDQASSVVWGMPGAVANAGLAGKVIPLDQIAQEIDLRARVGRIRRSGRPVPETSLDGSSAVGRAR
jgi:two-component system chemotaxis response regulator CheB